MKIVGLIYLFTPVLAFTMDVDVVLESEPLESVPCLIEEAVVIEECGEPALAEEPVAFSEIPETEAQCEESVIEASQEVAADIEPDSLNVEVVPAAEKSLPGKGGQGQVKDPRINSNRPRVTHREASEQQSDPHQVVQENDLEVEDQALGQKEPVIPVPQESTQRSVVQEDADQKPQAQKTPQTTQPRSAAPQTQPNARPKQNSGAPSTRPLNRNSVYQDEPIQEKAQNGEEGEVKALSLKAEPNRVMLISRLKSEQLIAAEKSVPEQMQRAVPLERKKVQVARENPALGYKQRNVQTAPKGKTKSMAQGKTFRHGYHPGKSHATVYTQTPSKV